ncbi:MAG: FxDxF family PEP-CTERM protein [Acidobacteriota bacterium]
MNWKHALAATAASLSTAAMAAGPGNLGYLDNLSTDIGHTLGSPSTPFNGAFTDVFTFDLLNPGLVKGGIHSTPGLPFGIKSLKVALSGGSLSGAEEFFMDERTATINFLEEDLAKGHYTLTVTGSVFGGKGSYGGDLSAVTAAVPEPGPYVLALAGAGLVVSLRSRRRKSDPRA